MNIKKCPFCGEDINQVAIKCRHCKSDLSGGVVTAEYCGQHEPVEPDVMIDYRCLKCHISIQEGVNLCGNCKAQLAWKDGQPKLATAYVLQQTGCALNSLGCLNPILIGFVFLLKVIFSM